mmetsp:Transcript_31608/g.74386  ORF Transcript_31608/g.74386 Transcript_31608/m.74386 type:complete len:257 (+) Transcript_31608:315-1085(+)
MSSLLHFLKSIFTADLPGHERYSLASNGQGTSPRTRQGSVEWVALHFGVLLVGFLGVVLWGFWLPFRRSGIASLFRLQFFGTSIPAHGQLASLELGAVHGVHGPLRTVRVGKGNDSKPGRSSVGGFADFRVGYGSELLEGILEVLPGAVKWQVADVELFGGLQCWLAFDVSIPPSLQLAVFEDESIQARYRVGSVAMRGKGDNAPTTIGNVRVLYLSAASLREILQVLPGTIKVQVSDEYSETIVAVRCVVVAFFD